MRSRIHFLRGNNVLPPPCDFQPADAAAFASLHPELQELVRQYHGEWERLDRLLRQWIDLRPERERAAIRLQLFRVFGMLPFETA